MAVRLLAAALGVCTVLADLPVHCLYGQTVGNWNFKMGPKSEKGIQETCGHDLPDSVMTMPNSGISYEKPNFEVKKEFSVTLEEPNIAKASDGRTGTWTMVYDEGFELNLGGERIFHFFKYTPKTKDADEAELTDFNSHCHTTFSGWVTESGETSCVIAQKDAKSGNQIDVKAIGHSGGLGPVQPGFNGVPVDNPEGGIPVTPEVPCISGVGDPIECTMGLSSQHIYGNEAAAMRFGEKNMHHHQLHTVSTRKKFHEDAEFVSDTVFIEMINSDSTKTWRAKAHKHFEGRKMQHMMKMLGQTNFKKNAVNQVRAKASTTTEETLANYPKELNWHTKDDGAYATPVASQGSCGSCYAIAATDTANMKRKILAATVNGGARFKSEGSLRSSRSDTKGLKPFSVQTALSCSDTNQGCEGGYPLLEGKYFSEVGLVEEGTAGCADYNADDEACNWDCMKDESKVFKGKDYQYVGGYYGNGNEEGMVKAMQSGPIIIALNAPSDLFYYGEGTYSAPLAKDADQYNVNGVGRWEKTNHAVVGVGYGEGPDLDDSGKPMKYWMIKNSWGESWGQNGFFKMKRGTDDAAVESMAVQFELCDPKGNCTGNKEEGAPAAEEGEEGEEGR